MKLLRSAWAAAVLISLGSLSHEATAEQPSIDRLALESGVIAWVSAWNSGEKPFDLNGFARLYSKAVITSDGEHTYKSWDEYAATVRARLEPFVEMQTKPAEDVKISVDDRRAETAFVIHPAGKRRDGSEVRGTDKVRLVWTKTGGMWRIAEQQIVRSKVSDTGAVAAR